MGTWTWDGNCSSRPSLSHLKQGLEVTNPEKHFVQKDFVVVPCPLPLNLVWK